MKKIICCLLAAVLLFSMTACSPKKVTEEPDLTVYLDAYIKAQTEALRKKFGMDDLEIVLNNSGSPIFIKTHRETEEDIGEYDYLIHYYIYAPGFVNDLLERHEAKTLDYEDISLGEELMQAFSMKDFSVDNYVLGKYTTASCYCDGIIWDKDDTELTFHTDPIGDFNFGEIKKRWNFTDSGYEWDTIFYYNESTERIFYSQEEYDENALPPTVDGKSSCVKCGSYTTVTASGYCASCVKIYKSDWYIDWDGKVSIDSEW